jgi:O-6-methylguanine DNA methyltransferase
MALTRATIATPVGQMLALASAEALCALEFDNGRRHARLDARLAKFFEAVPIQDGDNSIIAATREWLARYFAGESADASTLSLDGRGTPFERRVWRALLAIPPGETRSYGQVAAAVASTVNASRAVGLANGSNPIAIVVPCHRVIGADGTLTGYGGGLDTKTWLLEHEQRFWPSDTSLHRVAPERGRRPKASRQPRLDF